MNRDGGTQNASGGYQITLFDFFSLLVSVNHYQSARTSGVLYLLSTLRETHTALSLLPDASQQNNTATHTTALLGPVSR